MEKQVESFFSHSDFTRAQQKVLDSALVLFVDKGYFKTTIPDIVEHSGVSTGSIYHAFGNKENLAHKMMEALLFEIEQQQREQLDGITASKAQYEAMANWLLDSSIYYPNMMRFVLYARHKEFMPDMKPLCSSKPFMKLRDVVSNGIEAGDIIEMDVMVAAASAFGGVLRMIQLCLDGAMAQPISAYRQDIVAAGWRSIAK